MATRIDSPSHLYLNLHIGRRRLRRLPSSSGGKMAHSRSLRVIGQSLEVTKVAAFELEKDGHYYVVRSDSLSQTDEWILRNALSEDGFTEQSEQRGAVDRGWRFSPRAIARLEAEGRKKRQNLALPHRQESTKLSQLLRTLGDHLDKMDVSTFHISWMPDAVSVEYLERGGQRDGRTFTREKLQQLGFHTRFRRSSGAS
jgi:hypothetical protein